MITIALDEGGHFENLKPTTNCMYIGGVVFQCKNNDARKKELERLQKFFKEICEKEGCKYPQDLHYNWYDGQVINSSSAEKVKAAVINLLPDFLNGTGAWTSNAPTGKYYLYALVGDKKGIDYFEDKGINTINSEGELSNLIDDNISCNRYEHMAYRTIENLLFYNLRFQGKEDNNVRLNLATRVFKVNDDEKLRKESLQTGHEKHDLYDSTFRATTLSSYRAALISMIQNSNRKDLQFEDIRVDSICYDNKPDINFYHGFLYLSDIICNIYGSILENCNQADTAIGQLWQNCQQYTPQRVFIWSYNGFDQKYREIYKLFIEKDYYTVLKNMYLVSKENEKNAKVYDSLWFDDIKKGILFSNEDEEFSFVQGAIKKLEFELSNSKIKADEAHYIFDFLKAKTEELCKKTDSESQSYGLLYTIYKSEMVILNHEGNHGASAEAFKNCLEFARYVNVEEFMELQNMYAVNLCDSLNFDEAIRIATKTCEYEDMLRTIKEEINPSESKYIHQGRTYSQLAQCYSFIENYEEAQNYFEKSLVCYGDDSFNRAITLSYYLHMLIEQKSFDEYKKYSRQYFHCETLKEQLISILDNYKTTPQNNAWMFMLFVFMKALYLLYLDTLQKNDLKLLKELLLKFDTVKSISNKENHPWELIYKYAAFCCLKVGNKEYNEKAKEYIKEAKNVLGDEKVGILQQIIDEIDVQYDSVLNGKDAFEKSQLTYMYR